MELVSLLRAFLIQPFGHGSCRTVASRFSAGAEPSAAATANPDEIAVSSSDDDGCSSGSSPRERTAEAEAGTCHGEGGGQQCFASFGIGPLVTIPTRLGRPRFGGRVM